MSRIIEFKRMDHHGNQMVPSAVCVHSIVWKTMVHALTVVRLLTTIVFSYIYPATPQLHLFVTTNDLVMFILYTYFNYDINRKALIIDPASINNVYDYMHYCVSLQADMTNTNTSGRTPLLIAVQRNNLEFARHIVLLGGDVNEPSGHDERPPLLYALKQQNNNMARMLIGAGAEINNTAYLLPVMVATSTNVGMIAPLIEAGADINLTSGAFDETPLMYAIRNENLEAVQILLDNHANLDDESPEHGFHEHHETQTTNICNKTPLKKAIQMGNNDIVEMLLERGANVDKHAPASVAILEQNIEALALLIQYNVDINQPNHMGVTPVQTLQRLQAQQTLQSMQSTTAVHSLYYTTTPYQHNYTNTSNRIKQYMRMLQMMINAGLRKDTIDRTLFLQESVSCSAFSDMLTHYHGDDHYAFTVVARHAAFQRLNDCIDVIASYLSSSIPPEIAVTSTLIQASTRPC